MPEKGRVLRIGLHCKRPAENPLAHPFQNSYENFLGRLAKKILTESLESSQLGGGIISERGKSGGNRKGKSGNRNHALGCCICHDPQISEEIRTLLTKRIAGQGGKSHPHLVVVGLIQSVLVMLCLSQGVSFKLVLGSIGVDHGDICDQNRLG